MASEVQIRRGTGNSDLDLQKIRKASFMDPYFVQVLGIYRESRYVDKPHIYGLGTYNYDARSNKYYHERR
jgi:hypothetical protein